MDRYFIVDLGHQERHGYVIGARLPESDPAYSPFLDVGFNRLSSSWKDALPHLHTDSEEYFILLNGRIDILIGDQCFKINRHHLLGVHANMPHQIIGGEAPIENFLIRVPGNGADKVTADSIDGFQEKSMAFNDQVIQIDLKKSHQDYLLGTCLPVTDPNYSSLLDFTCVWDADPEIEWHNEELHYHSQREEYYFVLGGRLNFEIDDSLVSLSAGQILGVRPGTVHRVIGGEGLVDVLFVRVPGGRGDKITL
jgi:mannose-6-phosphate isomerase-like protein (cupin superfamily)